METQEKPAAAEEMPVCEGCGGESAAVIDGKGWCVDCFQARGSCCHEAE